MSSPEVKKIIRQGMKCKMKGMCERDKLVTRYLSVRIDAKERQFKTLNKIYRANALEDLSDG